MRATNLAYIDQHVDRMLDRETRSPTPHALDQARAAKPRMIAGFEVKDQAHSAKILDQARNKRMEVVAHYRKMKAELLERVLDTGAKPLAILPTTMFNLICKQSDLYYVPDDLKSEVNPTHFLTWLAMPEGAPIDASLWTGRPRGIKEMRRGRGDAKSPEAYLEQFGREAVMKHLLTLEGTTFETEEEEADRLFLEALKSINDGEPGIADLITRPVPGTLRGRPQASPTDGKRYQLLLPVPPDDVCETLIKIADLNPKTVAVYGAVDFADGGVLPLLHQVKRDREERDQRVLERVDWRLHDPIVYVTRGPVTAVMAQFGPFPVEQAIVDRITAAEFLPQA